MKTPIRIQLDAAECGAACLGIVLEYHGRYVSASELRRKCEISRSGSHAAGIIRAANELGLDGRGYRVEPDQLKQMQLPAIIHWRMSHFVVLEGFNSLVVFINDPAVGRRRITWQEFGRSFTGIALTFDKNDQFDRGGTKPSLLGGIKQRLQGHRATLVYAIIVAVLAVVPTLFFAIGSQVFIDTAIIRQDYRAVRPLLWILAAAVLFQAILFWAKASGLRSLRAILKRSLTVQFVDRLLQRPILFYAQRYPSELASRTRLNHRVAETISHDMVESVAGILAGLCYLVAMVLLSPVLSAFAIVLLILNVLFVWAFSPHRTELAHQLAGSEGRLLGSGIESIESIETAHATGLGPVLFCRWHHFWRESLQYRLQIQTSFAAMASLNVFTTAVAGSLIIAIGGYLVMRSQITLGTLIAFQLLIPFVTGPIKSVVELFGQLQILTADLSRLEDVTEEDAGSLLTDGKVRLLPDRSEESTFDAATLDVQNLEFGFRADGKGLLEDVSFQVSKGEWLGVTGKSGSGKTTLVRLLAGLYPHTEGHIRWNETDFGDQSSQWAAQAIGYVDQASILFSGTLRENLTFGQNAIDDRTLVQICKELGLIDLVQNQSGGLGAMVHESGRNVSGGERQRVDLARLLVRPYSAFLLDEATSALDIDSEREVLSALRKRGTTCVFVSHRPSVLASCDHVLVMDEGKIVASGTHEELSHTDVYRQLTLEDQG